MKRNLSVLLAALLVFAVAGQAAAFFEDFNLIRSIYTTAGTVEVGSDLGVDSRTLSLASPVDVIPPYNPVGSLISLTSFGSPTSASSLQIGYWAHGQSVLDFWATGNYQDGDGLTMLPLKGASSNTVFNAVQTGYTALSDTATSIVSNYNNDDNDYQSKFENIGNGVGLMGAALTEPEMTINLADLLTNGYVDQYLYYFDYNNQQGKAGVEVAVIRTFLTSDGTTISLSGDKIATTINPSAVPVPAAVWLLGTGIVGLVGIRRRKS